MPNGMTLKGDRKLRKLFNTLGERVQRKVLRAAVSASATPVLKSARSKAKRRTGLLKKSLGRKVATNKKRQSVTAVIGPRRNVTGEVDGTPYKPSRTAHLVEKGFINERGEHVAPQPFLNPAMAETEGQALDAMRTKLAAGVAREASKGK